MGAPLGNKFWQLRSKHGRDKLFESPDLLWEAACEYFTWIDENPLIQVDFKGKDAERVEIPHVRPYTIHGLTSYLGCNVGYFNEFAENLKNSDVKDFSVVIAHIRETIYRQKFEGASCGFYNANIIARDLGLQETVNNVGTTTTKIVVQDKKTEDAIKKMKEKFDNEH